MIEVEIAILDFKENLVSIITLEGQVATHKNVKEHSDRPTVNLFTVRTF